jgi:ABC-type polysaccharide/polyol phosphate transport system ATPase subunit
VGTALVEVEDLWVGYRRRIRRGLRPKTLSQTWGLQGVNLRVAPGELVGVIGPNGSGKTTLLQSIVGVIHPTRGTVRTTGQVSSLIDLTAGFHRELSGRENLFVQAVLLGVPKARVEKSYDEIVAFSGLADDVLDAPFRTYSAGMGLRLGFSLVAFSEPDVLLVDEVLAVGDEAFEHRCLRWLEEQRGGGTAIVLVTHELGLVEEHADRVVVLDDGEIRFEGAAPDAVAWYHKLVAAQEATEGKAPPA